MSDLNKLKEKNKVWLREIGSSLKLASRDEINAAKLMQVGDLLATIHIDLDKQPANVFTAQMEDTIIHFKSEAYELADIAEEIETNRFKGDFYRRVMTLGTQLISFSSSIPALLLPVVTLEKMEFVGKLLVESLN